MRKFPSLYHRALKACLAMIFLALPMFAQDLQVVPGQRKNVLVYDLGDHSLEFRKTTQNITDYSVRSHTGHGPIAITWLENDGDGNVTPWYGVSLDGKQVHSQVADYELKLRYDRFDPFSRTPGVPEHLSAAEDSQLYVVQFWTQGLEHYRAQLSEMGVVIQRFLASYAHIVEMDATTAASVSQLPFVRWVGPFHPAYKLDESLQNLSVAGEKGEKVSIRLNILSMNRGEYGQNPVVQRIAQLGGVVNSQSRETYLLSATLPVDQVLALAAEDSVQWMDPWSAPEDDMDIAREFHGADFVETVAGYTGMGVNVEVMDGGCDEIHPDMQNFVVHTTNTPSNHGTATSGIVVGSGLENAEARGVMPDAFLSIADYSYISGGSRYNHTAELQDSALPYQSVLQSNSWGSARTFFYTSVSQDLDLILFDHDRISILQSQSNAGNQDSRPQAWSKNVISIGGVRHYGTISKTDDAWANGGSIGPADDGRIKPDLASFYDATLCTDRVGSAGYTSTNYYASFGGTSGATPIVAGHLGLMYQMWSDGIFGNSTPGGTVFENRPYNTTAKALLINTSTQWNFSGTSHDLTRVHQGWGHPDLVNAYDIRNNLYIVDESDVLTELTSTVHAVDVSSGTPELKATMIYSDPPGTTSSSQHRINNLDLKVTSPSGTVYWGNNGLLANMWSTAGGSPNTLDTVENVFIQNPEVGSWQVEVIAAEINQDGHTDTPAVDTNYALVVSGVSNGVVGPQPPVASFVYNANMLNVTFDGSASSDSDGSIVSYDWDFGDGSLGSGVSPVYAYDSDGTYLVVLTVTDNDNQTDTFSMNVSVSSAIQWTVLSDDDFESGWGSYTDGGSDCRRSSSDAVYAHQGTYCVRIRDNSGSASSFYATNGQDLTSYNELKVNFWFQAVSMETGEDFFLEYWDGSSWSIIGSWASGVEFTNGSFYNPEIVIDANSYNFAGDAKIRLRCDASANGDRVYIDELVVSAR